MAETKLSILVNIQGWRWRLAKIYLHAVALFWSVRGWPGDVDAVSASVSRFVVAGIKIGTLKK